jgi:hypothetical protein
MPEVTRLSVSVSAAIYSPGCGLRLPTVVYAPWGKYDGAEWNVRSLAVIMLRARGSSYGFPLVARAAVRSVPQGYREILNSSRAMSDAICDTVI